MVVADPCAGGLVGDIAVFFLDYEQATPGQASAAVALKGKGGLRDCVGAARKDDRIWVVAWGRGME